MIVSELAKRASVSADTVRHYTKIGLLKPVRDTTNGYKHYGRQDYRTLCFAQKARLLGFSLKDIVALVENVNAGGSVCPDVRELMVERKAALKERIKELQQLHSRMEVASTVWASMADGALSGNGGFCNLIEHWDRMPPRTMGEQGRDFLNNQRAFG